MGKHALKTTRYCCPCAEVSPPIAVRQTDFAIQNNISVDQIFVLVRKRILLAKKVKGINFVAFNPGLIAQGLTIEDFI